MVDQETSH